MDNARKISVAYVSESYGPHDHRFLTAAREVANEVWHIQTDSESIVKEERPNPVGVSRTRLIPPCELGERINAIRAALEEIKPDVVHAGPIQRVTFPVLLATKRPVIAASWGSDLARSAMNDPVWRDVASFCLLRSSGFLCDCLHVENIARQLGYSGPVARFPWGIDVSKFCPDGPVRKFGKSSELAILSTRNWEEIYDVETLARAFKKIEIDAHLVLCGSGSGETRLRSMLEKETLKGKVTWLGNVRQSELPAIYRGADIYVSTSKSDGSSVSLLEAMSCARPILVSDIAGNREWVENDQYRFGVGDDEELKAALIHFSKMSSVQREEQGQLGRRSVLLSADWSKAPQKLAALYFAVIE